jgi:hypothetical protein
MRHTMDINLKRENLLSNKEIIKWWNAGRGSINLLFFIYSVLHICVIAIAFKNDWIFIYGFFIVCGLVLINLIFSLGMLFEFASKFLIKSHFNFDIIGPKIKAWEIIVSALLTIGFSVWDIINQSGM